MAKLNGETNVCLPDGSRWRTAPDAVMGCNNVNNGKRCGVAAAKAGRRETRNVAIGCARRVARRAAAQWRVCGQAAAARIKCQNAERNAESRNQAPANMKRAVEWP